MQCAHAVRLLTLSPGYPIHAAEEFVISCHKEPLLLPLFRNYYCMCINTFILLF